MTHRHSRENNSSCGRLAESSKARTRSDVHSGRRHFSGENIERTAADREKSNREECDPGRDRSARNRQNTARDKRQREQQQHQRHDQVTPLLDRSSNRRCARAPSGPNARLPKSQHNESGFGRNCPRQTTHRGETLTRGRSGFGSTGFTNTGALMNRSPTSRERLDSQDRGRLCATDGCDTVLSRYNRTDRCGVHAGHSSRSPARARSRMSTAEPTSEAHDASRATESNETGPTFPTRRHVSDC